MRVGLYARVSTSSDEQEAALEQQLDRLRASGTGHETVEFIDVASGTRDDRPQLKALLKACREGQLDRVICTRLDRLSRSMAHGAELLTYFSAEDTPSLLALDDALDLATIGGRLVARMLINLGQAESERLSERVRHGRSYQRKQLIPLGPKAPYGYRFNAERTNYELDPETAPAAQRLVDEFLVDGCLRRVLRLAKDLPGCPWTSVPGLRAWLMNPTLAGYRVYGHDESYRDDKGLLKKRRLKPGHYLEIIAEAHQPLITAVKHAQVQALIHEHSNRKISGLRPGYVRELTKLVVCSHCGRVMNYQHHVRLGPVYLRCAYFPCASEKRNRIKVQTVKDAIWAKLQANIETLVAYEMSRLGVRAGHLDEAVALEQEIRELEGRQDPDLREAILRKRMKLETQMQMHGHRLDIEEQPSTIRKALEDPEGWRQIASDPTTTRVVFTHFLEKVLVRDRKVEVVVLRLGECGAMSSLGLG
jgi:DNA invertase Pin-like site-specific DNA recombinase